MPRDAAEAVTLQHRLRHRVVSDAPLPAPPRLVAGLDVSYESSSAGGRIAGAVVVLHLPDLSIAESVTSIGTCDFPYVPGLLAFREVPILLSALEKLTVTPDVLVCDGYGIAHPRRFGLACFLGVTTGLPAFGVAKTPFVGTFDEVPDERGAFTPLVHEGETVGRALRTQRGVKPVFVSPGHLIDMDDSTGLALRLALRYRLPETTRRADRLSRDALREALSSA
ncbi:endonuclease V [Sinosporangium siamense]|uniref:Endonuclease V n=1 Tax=Sinosporangium siamense TaxID=1367973 RepID=A0A919RFR1_9ACTN|nr:endonuclease V [Sinosporangium siamense]GII91076.1 endonuclease V [Sinosporangium siamense]